MKKLLKKLLPTNLLLKYHYFLSLFYALKYGFPSKKMIVIGVTGTKGKTTAINFIWACLMAGGLKTGLISTANIKIGEEEVLNKYHMTMTGPEVTQKLMAQMVKQGCKYCVVETTSEGIKQYRHIGINYDFAVFTNLTPEHLQSHEGSFEKYKQMKQKMFVALAKHKKVLDGKVIKKVIIGNNDDQYVAAFMNFPADKKISYAMIKSADYKAEEVKAMVDGVSFLVKGAPFEIRILGKFNVYNALPAIIIARYFGVSDQAINQGLKKLTVIPGRMEKISEGQKFTIIVDYAHEKESMTNLLTTAKEMKAPDAKVIVLLGAEGGGRDKAKRPIMGELSAKLADYAVVSNVDPYEDDPTPIVEDIAMAAEKSGKVRGQNLFVIEDRRAGINKALALAKDNDIVLITGKGAEQSIVIGGKKFEWDDRVVVREELKKRVTSN